MQINSATSGSPALPPLPPPPASNAPSQVQAQAQNGGVNGRHHKHGHHHHKDAGASGGTSAPGQDQVTISDAAKQLNGQMNDPLNDQQAQQ